MDHSNFLKTRPFDTLAWLNEEDILTGSQTRSKRRHEAVLYVNRYINFYLK